MRLILPRLATWLQNHEKKAARDVTGSFEPDSTKRPEG